MRIRFCLLLSSILLTASCAQQPLEPEPSTAAAESSEITEAPDGSGDVVAFDPVEAEARRRAAEAALEEAESIRLHALEMSLSSILERQARVWTVGSRLRTAGAPLCDEVRYTYGFFAVDRDDFGSYWARVADDVGLEPGVRVWTVRDDIDAVAGTLSRGDRIVTVDDETISDFDSFADAMSRPQNDGVLMMTVERSSGEIVDVGLQGIESCDYRVALVEDDMTQTFVKGRDVYVTSGLLDFFRSDDELAVMLAHEMAHDSLGHFTRKQVQAFAGVLAEVAITVFTGVGTGGSLARLGQTAFAGGMERKADWLSLYIVARAGYDASVAPELWTRIASELPIEDQGSLVMHHPISPRRVQRMQVVSSDVARKLADGEDLVPTKHDDDDEQLLTAEAGDEELIAGVVRVVPVETLLPIEREARGDASVDERPSHP